MRPFSIEQEAQAAEEAGLLSPEQAAGASKQRGQRPAAEGGDADSDVVIVDDAGGDEAASADSHNGFYRASRETGRANILLALQVCH